MRLTHLKLAGFKSFVDPTQIPLPGQIVGIVGPNGCGKSNVIDAVRWVLGESSARHLRGETMQDVIFNGAGDRKPAARASVEMHFDNSLGKAGGPWSEYAEIVVKRLLQRDGDSSYYINNLHVRRRDVADIFLGTGLGGRAYAIIEQGTISRIVEAKPEELRVFLEEAAGVSKYRERRRETELRLSDTRDNLTRVEDIVRELEAQVEHLGSQAEAAQRYKNLRAELGRTQQLLWFVKRQELGNQRGRLQRELERVSLELEGDIARLREAEKRVEQLRMDHYAAGDSLHGAQGELYEANAEVARLEQELQFVRDNRSRAEQHIVALESRIEQSRAQRESTRGARQDWDQRLAEAANATESCQSRLEAEGAGVPGTETEFRARQAEVESVARALSEIEQKWRVEETRREHADKVLTQHSQRGARLLEERGALVHPEAQTLADQEQRIADLDTELGRLTGELARIEYAVPGSEEAARCASDAVEEATRRLAELSARLNALEQVQSRVVNSELLGEWLARHGIDALPRLWQDIDIESGWEDALESVLRERLNAIELGDLSQVDSWFGDPPPGKLAMFRVGAESDASPLSAPDRGLPRLVDLVKYADGALSPLLEDWLARVYLVEDGHAALAARHRLEAGEMIVCRRGHMFTRHSAVFHAPDSDLHGVIRRQREIEHLRTESAAHEAVLAETRTARDQADSALRAARHEIDLARQRLEGMRQERHRLQLDHLKVMEQADRVRSRDAQIERELTEIDEHRALETSQRDIAAANLARFGEELELIRSRLATARECFSDAEQALERQRQQLQGAERSLQEAVFQHKTCAAKLDEMHNQLRFLDEQAAQEAAGLAELQAERLRFDEAPLGEVLQGALVRRGEREQRVAAARVNVESVEASLRRAEEDRLASEQELDPMRERINELRLKVQEARLHEESFAQQLQEAQANETELASMLEKGMRSGALNSEIARLDGEIGALGAVNLAAVDELAAATERKGYLDAQFADLTEAMGTLEAAIRKIDRETRERLLATFEQVNSHLGEMFPALFGGGQAKLMLTGEEILDSGVQVIAQPPGKKNTSIHLLSGGEKALSALSLVFSLFMLNPAPFCLLDEVDAPLDDTNTDRFCELLKKMSTHTQFIVISHNKITMEIAEQLVGVTMQELGVSRVVAVDVEEAMKMQEEATA